MAYRGTRMNGLRLADPVEWERRVRGAMAAAEGRIPDAAAAVGVSTRTLFRWLQDPLFADVSRVPNGETRPGNRRGRHAAAK